METMGQQRAKKLLENEREVQQVDGKGTEEQTTTKKIDTWYQKCDSYSYFFSVSGCFN